MPPKRQLRPSKTEEQEKKDLEDCIPKATRKQKTGRLRFSPSGRYQRSDKDPSQEQSFFKVGLAKIQSLKS